MRELFFAIGYATHNLLCCRQCALVNELATATLRFGNVCTEDLDYGFELPVDLYQESWIIRYQAIEISSS